MRCLFLLTLTAALATLAAPASAGTSSETQSLRVVVCGQLTGPANAWSMPSALARQLGLPARMRGRTWTVVARGTPCAFAMRNTRALLKLWTKTRPGGLMRTGSPPLRGWICGKDRVPRGGAGSPGAQCIYLGVGRRFGFVQLGSLSLAKVKELAAKRTLPIG